MLEYVNLAYSIILFMHPGARRMIDLLRVDGLISVG